jgi:hypothetical protein
MAWFVRFCALYNALGVVTFLTPGLLPALGVAVPSSPFWVWLPALMATFAALVLFFSSFNLERNASFPYWNGIIRLIFVIVTFALGFGQSAGIFIVYLALGDLPLSLGAILGLPRVLRKSHLALLMNR